jgi:hypothetical protein
MPWGENHWGKYKRLGKASSLTIPRSEWARRGSRYSRSPKQKCKLQSRNAASLKQPCIEETKRINI